MKFGCVVRFSGGGRCSYEGGCMDDVRKFVAKVLERMCEVDVLVDDKVVYKYYEWGSVVDHKFIVWGVWEKKGVVVKETIVDRVNISEGIDTESFLWTYWRCWNGAR